LEEKYPEHTFSLIMGEDNLKSFHKWKNYEAILAHHEIYVYPRVGFTDENDNYLFKNHPKIHLIDAPVVELSSTAIREHIKKGKNVLPLLPPKVWEYIDHNNFYKK
jgi:nicotinate-nucleotide adenylyltransferase